jgi:DEAD/DEAH box helicase domain-containing protein
MNYITFDIETYIPEGVPDRIGSKLNVEAMKVAVIGAYYSWIDGGTYVAFLEENVADFLASLQTADCVIGYNHIWFDNAVLQKYADFDLKTLPNWDLMQEAEKSLVFKPKLDDLCKSNLGTQKTDSFETYRNYYRDGKMFELTDYCMHDVLLTEKLHQLVQKNGHLLYSDAFKTRQILITPPNFSAGNAKVMGNESLL